MRTCLLLPAAFSFSGVAAAQAGPCTEARVKAAKTAAAKGALPHSPDNYFFSGALDKPVIGAQASGRAATTITASRKNESEVESTGRIVADESGGMAYEYGTVHITFDDVRTGQHEDLPPRTCGFGKRMKARVK